MRGSPISRSRSGRSPLPQGSRITVALTERSLEEGAGRREGWRTVGSSLDGPELGSRNNVVRRSARLSVLLTDRSSRETHGRQETVEGGGD